MTKARWWHGNDEQVGTLEVGRNGRGKENQAWNHRKEGRRNRVGEAAAERGK